MSIEKRKNDHIRLAKEENTSLNFELDIDHVSLPTFDFDEINLETLFLGHKIKYPIYINAMTGGSKSAQKINEKLALYAKKYELPIVLGSQSAALKNEKLIETYSCIKKIYPNCFLVSNISANYNYKDALKAINMVNANALSIHLNLLQELIMKEGDRKFRHWQKNIKEIVENINVPVLVKEVGFGMSKQTIKQLENLNVKYIDISGYGGTNFARIERRRQNNNNIVFDNIGISTYQSLINAKNSQATIYASGGINNGLDVFKALYLGAEAVGLSNFFLKLTDLEDEIAFSKIEELINEIKVSFMIYGFKNIKELKNN